MNRQHYDAEFAALQHKHMVIDMFQHVAETTGMSVQDRIRYPDMFRGWSAGEVFTEGEFVRHGFDAQGDAYIYRVVGDHTAQANIPPDGAFSGNQYVIVSHEEGIRLWSRPICSKDAYPVGAIRRHNGETWRNTIDGNRFSPEQVGWEKQ